MTSPCLEDIGMEGLSAVDHSLSQITGAAHAILFFAGRLKGLQTALVPSQSNDGILTHLPLTNSRSASPVFHGRRTPPRCDRGRSWSAWRRQRRAGAKPSVHDLTLADMYESLSRRSCACGIGQKVDQNVAPAMLETQVNTSAPEDDDKSLWARLMAAMGGLDDATPTTRPVAEKVVSEPVSHTEGTTQNKRQSLLAFFRSQEEEETEDDETPRCRGESLGVEESEDSEFRAPSASTSSTDCQARLPRVSRRHRRKCTTGSSPANWQEDLALSCRSTTSHSSSATPSVASPAVSSLRAAATEEYSAQQLGATRKLHALAQTQGALAICGDSRRPHDEPARLPSDAKEPPLTKREIIMSDGIKDLNLTKLYQLALWRNRCTKPCSGEGCGRFAVEPVVTIGCSRIELYEDDGWERWCLGCAAKWHLQSDNSWREMQCKFLQEILGPDDGIPSVLPEYNSRIQLQRDILSYCISIGSIQKVVCAAGLTVSRSCKPEATLSREILEKGAWYLQSSSKDDVPLRPRVRKLSGQGPERGWMQTYNGNPYPLVRAATFADVPELREIILSNKHLFHVLLNFAIGVQGAAKLFEGGMSKRATQPACDIFESDGELLSPFSDA
mmetsp:Transcript_32982/g.60400  ORF Transcript_32982/g.60400 Transcript_32982/m.60400 type:complete len:615 (-) Transcript_32982:54-1898(-)